MFISEMFNHADYTTTSATAESKKISKQDDPCWKGYHMVGTKSKGTKEVPNCVPVTEDDSMSDVLRAREYIGQAVSDPTTKHEYFNFLKSLRTKHGADYSTHVHQQAAKLAKGF